MSDLRDLGGSAFRSVLERVGRGVAKAQERKPLAADLLESDDAYLVVFDAPGAERSDVQVRFVQGEVQVRVDRFREFHEEFEMRFPGRGLALSGSAALPPDVDVDADGAEATLTRAGTLQVYVPKDGDGTDVPVGEAADEAETAGGDAETVEVDRDDPAAAADGDDEE